MREGFHIRPLYAPPPSVRARAQHLNDSGVQFLHQLVGREEAHGNGGPQDGKTALRHQRAHLRHHIRRHLKGTTTVQVPVDLPSWPHLSRAAPQYNAAATASPQALGAAWTGTRAPGI